MAGGVIRLPQKRPAGNSLSAQRQAARPRPPQTPSPAGVVTRNGTSAEHADGMGIALASKSESIARFFEKQKQKRAASGLGQDPSAPCLPLNSPGYSCSAPAVDFIHENIAASKDFEVVDITGCDQFNRNLGCHIIPLSEIDPGCSGRVPGAFFIPDGFVLVITDFSFAALIEVPGMGGMGTEEIALSDIAGSVTFGLLQQNGGLAFSQSTIIAGKECRGGGFMNPSPAAPGLPFNNAMVRNSIRAAYFVNSPPFPGFPAIVCANIRGFLVNEFLLKEALEICEGASIGR